MQAVILVGGKGTRLRPLTDTRPKPMMTVVDRPFVAHQLDNLRRHGVTDVVFSCGYLPDALRDHFGDGAGHGLAIRYVVDPVPLGTAGAVRNALPALDERRATLVLNGDVLTDLDITTVLAQHRERSAMGTIVLTPVEDPGAFGLVRLHDSGAVEAFVEKPRPEDLRPGEPFRINAGTYVLEPDLVREIPEGVECSIEREVFPDLAARGLIFGHPSDAYWLDIGTPAAYLAANVDVLSGAVRTESPTGTAYLAPGARVAGDASVGEHSVVGRGSEIGAGATLARSVIGEESAIGENAALRGCVLGSRVTVGEGARLGDDVVVGDGATVAPGAAIAGPFKVPTDGYADEHGVREPAEARGVRGDE